MRSSGLQNLFERTVRSKAAVLAVGFLLVLILGISDQASGPDLSFLIFYLAPVLFVSWYVGEWAGILISIASTLVWYLANDVGASNGQYPLIPIWNSLGRLAMFVMVAYVIGKMRSGLRREKQLSRTDYLTGLANRRYFTEALDIELGRSRRHNWPLTLAYMDLDAFKTVNDQFGHEVGDEVLKAVGRCLLSNTRREDLIARLGGDEFGILLPETDYEGAQRLLPRLQECLAALAATEKWPISFSIGAVIAAPPAPDVDDLMRTADTLMYAVKRDPVLLIEYEVVGPQPPLRVERGGGGSMRRPA